MSEAPKENIDIDREKLQRFLPQTAHLIESVVQLADVFTTEACDQDPVIGRQFTAELQKRIELARPLVTAEVMAKLRAPYLIGRGPDKVNAVRQIKSDLYGALKFPSPAYNPEMDLDGSKREISGTPLVWRIKDQLIRCFKLSLLLALFQDPLFAPVAEANVNRAAEIACVPEQTLRTRTASGLIPPTQAAPVLGSETGPPTAVSSATGDKSSGDVSAREAITYQYARALQDDYFTVVEYRKFRAVAGTVQPFVLEGDDVKAVRRMADEVFAEILKCRDYDMEGFYTYDTVLGKPLVEIFEKSSYDAHQRDENICVVLLTGDKPRWLEMLKENRHVLEDLAKGTGIRKQTRAFLEEVHPTAVGNELLSASGLSDRQGVSFFTNSFPVGIRWSDGELVIPNAHIPVRELFPPEEQGWVEFMRLSLLMKLRSVLLKAYPDPTAEVGPVLTRKGGSRGAKQHLLRAKIFPRRPRQSAASAARPLVDETAGSQQQASQTEGASAVSSSIKSHAVTGHRMRLREGFYANPAAVALAKAAGVELAFIVVDGEVRYVETWVQDYTKPPQPGLRNLAPREARFRS